MRTLHPIELECLRLIHKSGIADILPMFYTSAAERLFDQGYIWIERDVPHPATGEILDRFNITAQGELVLRLHEADRLALDLGRA